MTPPRSLQPTKKQQAVLEFIKKQIIRNGFPPTVREIAGHFGFASPLSAQLHINALVEKGCLERSPFKQRSLGIAGLRPAEDTKVPLLGRVRAGAPLLASEDIEDHISIDRDLFRTKKGFALRVTGDSMTEAGILEGDIALIDPDAETANGDIVIALIEDEATIKRFFLEKGTIRLVPENREMKPVTYKASDVRIIGKVTGILRKL